jgi:DNA modification methylase
MKTHHRLIKGDSAKVLKSFPDNSLHLAVTSPPYFNAREYSQWPTLEDYLEDMTNIFKEVFRILDNHRVFVLNVGDVNCLMGKQPWTKRRVPLGALFTVICQKIGFEYVDNYIWNKGEPQSYRHMKGDKKYPFYHYPVNSYEHILIFHKHVKDMTRFPCPVCGTSKVQNNSQTEIGVQSWECNNEKCPHRSPGNRGKRYSARSIMMERGQTPENKIEDKLLKKWRKDIVEFPPVIKMYNGKNKIGHTAPFPEDIPEMAIKFYTYVGDTILDPFAGSFTTSIVAMKTGRNSVGIDINKEFVELGLRRLKEKLKQKTLFEEEHKIEVLKYGEIKNKILPVEKSKVFDKERYLKESKEKYEKTKKKLLKFVESI